MKRTSTMQKLSFVTLQAIEDYCKANNCGWIVRNAGREYGCRLNAVGVLVFDFDWWYTHPQYGPMPVSCVRGLLQAFGRGNTARQLLVRKVQWSTIHAHDYRTTLRLLDRVIQSRGLDEANQDPLMALLG